MNHYRGSSYYEPLLWFMITTQCQYYLTVNFPHFSNRACASLIDLLFFYAGLLEW